MLFGGLLSELQTPDIQKIQKNQSVTRMAGMMSLGTLVSRVLGFVRDRLIVQYFDSSITDIFYAAYRLPNFFRILLGEGALSVAFLPAYVELKHKKENEQGLAGTVFAFLAVVSFMISVLGIIFMPQLLEWFLSAKNFETGSAKFLETVFLARIMFFYLFLVSQFAFFMSLLNAHEEFWIPGVAPAAYNFGMILIVLFGEDFMGVPGSILAAGVIVGGVLQFSLVFLKSFQLKIVPKPNFLFRNPHFLGVLKRTAPSLLGIGAVQFIGVINVSLASSLNPSDITFLYLADRLLELPQSILAVSLGAALLPRLSSLWSNKNTQGFTNQLYETASMYYFLAIPAAVGLFTLGQALVAFLFKTSMNSYDDMAVIGSIVQVYAILLLVSGTSKLLLPGFYAVKNTFYPALSSVLVISIHIFLAPFLAKKYGVQGLVLSTTIATLSALFVTYLMFYRVVTPISAFKLFKSIPLLLVLNIPVFLICRFGREVWEMQSTLMSKNLVLVGIIATTVVVYFGLGVLFKVPYAKSFIRSLAKR